MPLRKDSSGEQDEVTVGRSHTNKGQREGTIQDLGMWKGKRAVLNPRLEGESHE